MGLDSIELLMEIETYFGIQIPDAEAERLFTIQLMVDSIAIHLGVTNEDMSLQDKIGKKINEAFYLLEWSKKEVPLSEFIHTYIPPDKISWQRLKEKIGMDVPKFDIIRKGNNIKISDKLKSLLRWVPSYDAGLVTMEQFINAICGMNYTLLLNKNNIRSKYDIYIAVMGITVDKIGVDLYEIGPEKSFTSDLGID